MHSGTLLKNHQCLRISTIEQGWFMCEKIHSQSMRAHGSQEKTKVGWAPKFPRLQLTTTTHDFEYGFNAYYYSIESRKAPKSMGSEPQRRSFWPESVGCEFRRFISLYWMFMIPTEVKAFSRYSHIDSPYYEVEQVPSVTMEIKTLFFGMKSN